MMLVIEDSCMLLGKTWAAPLDTMETNVYNTGTSGGAAREGNDLADSLSGLQLHVGGGAFGRRLNDNMHPFTSLQTSSQELLRVLSIGRGEVLDIADEDGAHGFNYTHLCAGFQLL